VSEGREKLSAVCSTICIVSAASITLLGAAVFLGPAQGAFNEPNDIDLAQMLGAPMLLLSLIAFVSFLIVMVCQIGIWTDWLATGRQIGTKRPSLPIVFIIAAVALGFVFGMPISSVDINVELSASKTLSTK
jgi:hypothetical protein